MPAKDDDKKPTRTTARPRDDAPALPKDDSPETVTVHGDMDPDLEAKRSGPPMSGDSMPKPLADDTPEPVEEQFDRSGPVPDPAEVEAKLKDPTFDPEGHERLRLAEESRRTGDPVPQTTDVDARGNPMMPGEKDG